MVIVLKIWGVFEYSFFAINLMSNLTQSLL